MLFQYQKFEPVEGAAPDLVDAAFCQVRMQAAFEGFDSKSTKPSYLHKLPSGAQVTGWQLEQCHVELLIHDFGKPVKYGIEIDGCVAGMWRIRAMDQLRPMAFSAFVTSAQADVQAESGEGLDAQSWTVDGSILMIGTEDGDSLSQRANERDWMPYRLKAKLAERFPQFLTEGLIVNLPGLDSAELAQMHFIVSWSKADAKNNAPWLAINRPPDTILKLAGCS